MVRYKKRYFVVEFERIHRVNKPKPGVDLEPLNSKDIDIAEAVKDKVTELHGDFGRASITVGFKVIYANKATRLAIMRVRHGPHTLIASSLPLLTHIRNEGIVSRLLYTGATVRHCHMFMVKRQTRQLELAKAGLKEGKKQNEKELENKILALEQIDSY